MVRAWTPWHQPTTSSWCTIQWEQPVFLSPMERRHQPGSGLREPSRVKPTAWQTCSRKVRAVTTSNLPHNATDLKVPAYSDPVKRWNFRKADWKRFCLRTGEWVERLPPPDTTNIEKAYQELYESLIFAAKQYKCHVQTPSPHDSWRTRHTRPGTASPPCSSTRKCQTRPMEGPNTLGK